MCMCACYICKLKGFVFWNIHVNTAKSCKQYSMESNTKSMKKVNDKREHKIGQDSHLLGMIKL